LSPPRCVSSDLQRLTHEVHSFIRVHWLRPTPVGAERGAVLEKESGRHSTLPVTATRSSTVCQRASSNSWGLTFLPIFNAANIASGEIATVSPLVQEVLRSPGQPLDPATRAFMEPRFDHDFGHVRMHTDAKAADSARVVCAHAYTMGRNVVFGQNEFAPATHQGRELLAHELAHTIQQRNPSRTPASADSQEVFEASASAAARNVINGGTVVRNLPACGLQIQRAPDSDPKRDEAARKASLRQYADPAWSDPLSPIREPESYDPKIYNVGVLRRKAAERKFDKYDQMEYGAHGVIYKKRGSGRVYANDIAAEDYK